MQQAPSTQRILAAIIDLVIINLLASLAAEWLVDMQQLRGLVEQFHAGQAVNPQQAQQILSSLLPATLMLSVVAIAIVLVVDAILPATKAMASPGKQLLGLAVVDMHGKRIGVGRAFGRHSAKFLSTLTLVGLVSFLWNAKKQALHDKICATLIVKRSSLGSVV